MIFLKLFFVICFALDFASKSSINISTSTIRLLDIPIIQKLLINHKTDFSHGIRYKTNINQHYIIWLYNIWLNFLILFLMKVKSKTWGSTGALFMFTSYNTGTKRGRQQQQNHLIFNLLGFMTHYNLFSNIQSRI